MVFNALEKHKEWYCVCDADTGCPYEIFALYEGAREYIDDIKLSGFSADGYIIQKITIGSVEVL